MLKDAILQKLQKLQKYQHEAEKIPMRGATSEDPGEEKIRGKRIFMI